MTNPTKTAAARREKAAEHRRNIERYSYLLDRMHDQQMRENLEKMLVEAHQHLVEIERDHPQS